MRRGVYLRAVYLRVNTVVYLRVVYLRVYYTHHGTGEVYPGCTIPTMVPGRYTGLHYLPTMVLGRYTGLYAPLPHPGYTTIPPPATAVLYT